MILIADHQYLKHFIIRESRKKNLREISEKILNRSKNKSFSFECTFQMSRSSMKHFYWNIFPGFFSNWEIFLRAKWKFVSKKSRESIFIIISYLDISRWTKLFKCVWNCLQTKRKLSGKRTFTWWFTTFVVSYLAEASSMRSQSWLYFQEKKSIFILFKGNKTILKPL